MIKKILCLATIFLLICNQAMATMYARCDGGTAAQCDGRHDAPLAGAVDGADADTLPDCAHNSPNYAIGGNTYNAGAAGLLADGEIVMIDGELRPGCPATASGRAEYEVGLNAPNMASGNQCFISQSYECSLNYLGGSSPANKKRIYGYGYNTGCKKPPQIWGSNALGLTNNRGVLNLNSNVALACLEITDHSGCMTRHDGAGTIDNSGIQDPIRCAETFSGSGPGRWANVGISFASGAHDVDITDVWVHGIALHGVWGNALTGIFNITRFYLEKNGYDNWTGLDNAHYSGNYVWTYGAQSFSGCGQKYPPTYPTPRNRAQSRDVSDVHNCWTQYGDGVGMSGRMGNWTVKRVDAYANSSDAWDWLYSNTGQTMVFAQNTCEGSSGACFKSGSGNVKVENNTMLGNCTNFKNNPIAFGSPTATGRSGSNCNHNGSCDANENYVNCSDCAIFPFCRANTPVSINVSSGESGTVHGNTIESNFDVGVYVQGISAGGNVSIKNNQIIGGAQYLNGTDMLDSAGGVYTDGTAVTITQDYNVICGTKNIGTDCSGQAHSQCFTNCTSLNLAGTMLNNNPTFYQGTDYLSSFYLTTSSPARAAADETVSMVSTAFDSTGFNRRTAWDIGGIEYRPVLHFSTDEFNVSQ